MGNCVSNSVNFEDEINLYHFVLHRAVGKGAFGKVWTLQPSTQTARLIFV